MVNRKKRLKKGIDSIEQEIETHKEKRKKAKAKEKVLMCEHRDKRKPHPLQRGGWGRVVGKSLGC